MNLIKYLTELWNSETSRVNLGTDLQGSAGGFLQWNT